MRRNVAGDEVVMGYDTHGSVKADSLWCDATSTIDGFLSERHSLKFGLMGTYQTFRASVVMRFTETSNALVVGVVSDLRTGTAWNHPGRSRFADTVVVTLSGTCWTNLWSGSGALVHQKTIQCHTDLLAFRNRSALVKDVETSLAKEQSSGSVFTRWAHCFVNGMQIRFVLWWKFADKAPEFQRAGCPEKPEGPTFNSERTTLPLHSCVQIELQTTLCWKIERRAAGYVLKRRRIRKRAWLHWT